MRHLITTKDFTNDEIMELLKKQEILDEKPRTLLEGKSVTTIFFENSTRTLSSFESAARRLELEFYALMFQDRALVKAKHSMIQRLI